VTSSLTLIGDEDNSLISFPESLCNRVGLERFCGLEPIECERMCEVHGDSVPTQKDGASEALSFYVGGGSRKRIRTAD
jgi:hypothetical protein